MGSPTVRARGGGPCCEECVLISLLQATLHRAALSPFGPLGPCVPIVRPPARGLSFFCIAKEKGQHVVRA